MGSTFLLVLVVIVAVSFDFTNGFHDTANAVATAIATGALKPRAAVLMSAVLNFVGAFISISVAATIAKGIVDPKILSGSTGMDIVFAALVGAVLWNLITWALTMPSSSSHALIGGVVGAAIAAVGTKAVQFHGLMTKVVAPAVLAPFVCALVALVGAFCAYRLMRYIHADDAKRGYRFGQIGTAAMVSLAHGTNDAQKTMGVISLALIAHGDISASHFYVPFWVTLACATAIALGTATGGWRIINTMGNRLTEIEPPQGFSAEAATASVILASSHYGYPLSTTQVVSGGVTGAGLGRKLASIHWGVIGQMVLAWLLTVPGAALIGASAWGLSDLIDGHSTTATLIVGMFAAAGAVTIYLWVQRKRPITADDLEHAAAKVASAAAVSAVPAVEPTAV